MSAAGKKESSFSAESQVQLDLNVPIVSGKDVGRAYRGSLRRMLIGLQKVGER
jgi:hypothetical protein